MAYNFGKNWKVSAKMTFAHNQTLNGFGLLINVFFWESNY